MSAAARGRCYCGQLIYRVEGPVHSLCVCHCESCRRAAGAAFVAWGTVDSDRFHIEQGTLKRVRRLQIERGFCADCGTSLTYQSHPAATDFTLASLDDPTLWPPQMHIWVADKLPWVGINDDLPQYPGSSSDLPATPDS
jgi:hypothetical protein